jgi:phage N-6-adenine-methyltransferase
MINKALFSSAKDDWETPQWFFEDLNKEFSFDIDLCATETNKKCKAYCPNIFEFAPYETRIGFMNPPYGRGIIKFINKAWLLSKNMVVVCLVPARTDTKWWSIFWDRENHKPKLGCQVRFLQGRLKFGNAKEHAPFPSAVIIMDRRSGGDL